MYKRILSISSKILAGDRDLVRILEHADQDLQSQLSREREFLAQAIAIEKQLEFQLQRCKERMGTAFVMEDQVDADTICHLEADLNAQRQLSGSLRGSLSEMEGFALKMHALKKLMIAWVALGITSPLALPCRVMIEAVCQNYVIEYELHEARHRAFSKTRPTMGDMETKLDAQKETIANFESKLNQVEQGMLHSLL